MLSWDGWMDLTFGLDSVWRAELVEAVRGKRKASVLEVATGTGTTAIMLARRFPNYSVTGLDFNEKALEIARERSRGIRNLKYINGNVEELSLGNNTFDFVVTDFSIGSFGNFGRALEEMHRVLKPGGEIVILDINRINRRLLRRVIGLYSNIVIAPAMNAEMKRDVERYVSNVVMSVDKHSIMEVIKGIGFKKMKARDLTFKLAFIMSAYK